ncbi:MAG: hypothetical protein KDA47_15100, partial [Planctomycetales bacterium]|nr:hypothetical protein [Planctomycetales bacterium]
MNIPMLQSVASAVRCHRVTFGACASACAWLGLFLSTPTVSAQTQTGRKVNARPAPTHADVRYGEHERNRFDLWLPKA